jgi:ATP-binding cassette subfamily B protein
VQRGRSWWLIVADLAPGTRVQGAIGVLLALAQAALLLPIAVLVRHIFDIDVPRDDHVGILGRGGLIALCYGASAALAAVAQGRAARAAKVALARVRRRLIATLELLPLSWHDRHDAGALHAVVVQDCERVDRMINSVMSQVLPAAAALLALTVVAVIIDPVLFVVVLVFVPLMLLTTRQFSRSFQRRLALWHRTAETLSSHTQLMLRGLATIRAAGAERRDGERFDHEIDAFDEAGYESAVARSRYQAIHGAIAAVAGVAVLVAGGLLVAGHHLTLGGLLAFYAIVGLMLRQTSTAQSSGPIILEGAIALRRVSALAAAVEPGAYAGTRRIDFHGAIELEGVSFTYDGADEPALREISVSIAAGEQVCVVGPSGAGKTTLMAVMLGLYRPQRGDVTADDVSLADLDLTDLRSQCGVILQATVLFRGTIRENLVLPASATDEAAITTAIRAAALDRVLATLAHGLDTLLGDDGAGLSGGERQRIAIARAILAQPRLMLLDEPTAHLPPTTTTEIIRNLAQLPWRPTILIITHDQSVAAETARTLQLRNGRLLELVDSNQCAAPSSQP